MDKQQERKIIKLVLLRVNETGECKIGDIAKEIVYYDISLSAKAELANKISLAPYLTTVKVGNDWLISRNDFQTNSVITLNNGRKLSLVFALAGLVLSIGVGFASWTLSQENNPPTIEQIQHKYKKPPADSLKKWTREEVIIDSLKDLDPVK